MGAQEDLLHDISNAVAVNNKKYSRYLKSKNLRNTEGRTDYSDAKLVTAIFFHPLSGLWEARSAVPCFLVPNTPVFFCSVNLHFGWRRRARVST